MIGKRRAKLKLHSLLLLLCLTAGCAFQDYTKYRSEAAPQKKPIHTSIPLPKPKNPAIINLPEISVVRLRGNGYQRGFQYGQAFSSQWHHAVKAMEEAALREIKPYLWFDGLSKIVYRTYTNLVFNEVDNAHEKDQSLVRLPKEYRAYIQGLADGADLESSSLTRLIATVMLSDASCSGFIAYGPATPDGRLIQLRNLDWGDPIMKPQQATVLLVHEPENGARYLSIGFVGLIGSVSGINEHGISLTEIGSESADKTRAGMPMPLMLESLLAHAKNLDEAIAIMKAAPGTGGYNFLIGSALERKGAVVEKSAHHTAVFPISPKNYQNNPYFKGFKGFDCRADTAADSTVRSHQLCSHGNGDPQSKTPPPINSRAYKRRYKPQITLFESFKHQINIEKAALIAAKVAPRDNLHSIIYDFEGHTVYVRNKAWYRDQRLPSKAEQRVLAAAHQEPAVVDLRKIFPKTTLWAQR